MDWVIAIPSFNRPEMIKKKTLALLTKHNIPSDKIYIFLADTLELERYASVPGNKIVGELGLVEQRNYICRHFPIGKAIVFMDDDVEDIVDMSGNMLDMANMFDSGFKACQTEGAHFWGITATKNRFFMKPGMSKDLKFICGSFFGIINVGEIEYPFGTVKEDYQRCIYFWERDHVIIRFNWLGVKTQVYKNAGGLQTGGRHAAEMRVVPQMLATWPQYLSLRSKRKSGYPELGFHRRKGILIAHPANSIQTPAV